MFRRGTCRYVLGAFWGFNWGNKEERVYSRSICKFNSNGSLLSSPCKDDFNSKFQHVKDSESLDTR